MIVVIAADSVGVSLHFTLRARGGLNDGNGAGQDCIGFRAERSIIEIEQHATERHVAGLGEFARQIVGGTFTRDDIVAVAIVMHVGPDVSAVNAVMSGLKTVERPGTRQGIAL